MSYMLINTRSLILLTMLACIAHSTSFFFVRDVTCSKDSINGCLQWAESCYVSKEGWTYYCFSKNTYLHTPEGPRSMAELKVGDMVLGIDPSTGKKGYSKVEAWLHHDPLAEGEFNLIQTNASAQFQASEMHNLAFVGSDGKINYKFAKEFVPGDQLVGFPAQGLRVTEQKEVVRRKGLYSPYTAFRNYFVYEDGFNPLSRSESEPIMALAHSLSQVVNPEGKRTLTKVLLWTTNLFSGAYQPEKDQIYTHPSVSHFSWVFGGSWRQAHNLITYDHDYYYSSSSYYSSSYYSDTRKQQKEHAMVRSVLASINLILSTSQH